MPESGSSGHVLQVLDWASLAPGSFRSQLFRDYLKSGSSTEDDLSMQLGDEPKPGAVFSRLPHDQRRVAASAFRSLTLMMSPSWTDSAEI